MSAVVQKLRTAAPGITVEKNFPMPEAKHGGKKLYPWDTMDVGDSFAFPRGTKATSARGQAHSAGKRYGRKFAVRVMPDGTYHCWRTA